MRNYFAAGENVLLLRLGEVLHSLLLVVGGGQVLGEGAGVTSSSLATSGVLRFSFGEVGELQQRAAVDPQALSQKLVELDNRNDVSKVLRRAKKERRG